MAVIAHKIAQELDVKPLQIEAAITLLDNGATVPFIARYRKEATQGLDDNHLRHLAQRLTYLRELDERRNVILTSIAQQGKLHEDLRKSLENAENKTYLEDLYLPFRPKRRTKGQIAIEAGLLPLADKLFEQRHLDAEHEAQAFIEQAKGLESTKQVLDGATAILSERLAEDAVLLQTLRKHLTKYAYLTSKVSKKKEKEAAKYQDYFAHTELLSKVPSHRALAMFRGRNESLLSLSLTLDKDETKTLYSSAEELIFRHIHFNNPDKSAFLAKVVQASWKSKLSGSLENELLGQLREKSEVEAIKVFARNLKDLLLAAPAGAKNTLGLDPGLRTGCKLAIVDKTGKLLHTATIFPHAPQNHWDKSVRTIVNLCKQYKVELVAIGNGTASRESDKLVADVIKQLSDVATDSNNENSSKTPLKLSKMMVSEAGASVYSASEFAAAEFPNLDVSLRGAVSIARRLQDPLAELVKIDPKAIGVGQYQHDVSQSQLLLALDAVIEDCVNNVGVDLNSASVALLTRVSGLNKTMAQNIVNYREEHGRFNDRNTLKKVARLGPKAFEQAAGFLRITDGKNPLDQSGVHPETYGVVNQILVACAEHLEDGLLTLLGNKSVLSQVNVIDYVSDAFGAITIQDILAELEKPGRDPRPEFKTAAFQEGVNTIKDLKAGMQLEGVISNVANFGAFVDIGVHQDGLVHISSLTDKFVKDPHEIVKAGDIVKVKVLEVDVARKRITLTMRLNEEFSAAANQSNRSSQSKAASSAEKNKPIQNKPNKSPQRTKKPKPVENAAMGNAFADAFAKLKK